MISQTIGKYHTESILGQNYSQGRITYKAIDGANNSEVVIKQFRFATQNSDWSGYKALEKEIQILEQLDHPSIPKYLGKIESSDGLCLIQEYINAPNCEQQKLSQKKILILAEQILEILTYIQSKNIVHKDIKPANILWDRDNEKAYLVDFGFSSLMHSHGASSTLAGTVGFMSPQQFFKREISPKNDLYSLGATLYVLLSGIRSEELGNQLDSRWEIPVNTLKNIVPEHIINWIKSLLKGDYNNAEIALDKFKTLEKAAKTNNNYSATYSLSKEPISTSELKFESGKSQELTKGEVLKSLLIPSCLIILIVYFAATHSINWSSILALFSSFQAKDFSELKTTLFPLINRFGIIWLGLAVGRGAYKVYEARLLGEEDSMIEGLLVTATMAAPVIFFKIIISG